MTVAGTATAALTIDGYSAGGGTFNANNQGGWNVDAAQKNCSLNQTYYKTISKFSSTRSVTVMGNFSYAGVSCNNARSNTITVAAATQEALSGSVRIDNWQAPKVGETLTTSISGLNVSAGTLMYTWRRDSTSGTVAASGNNMTTYTPTRDDVGHKMYCVVASPSATGSISDYTNAVADNAVAIAQGWYYITSSAGGRVLNVSGGSNVENTNVQIYSQDYSSAGLWYVAGSPSAGYTISTPSGKCLDVCNGSGADGTNVQIHTSNGAPAQKWRFGAPVGTFGTIESAVPGQPWLSLDSDPNHDGENVFLWNHNARARWKLDPATFSATGTLTGTAEPGAILTANAASAQPVCSTGAPGAINYEYTFYRGKSAGSTTTPVGPSATTATYTPVDADIDSYITCVITAKSATGLTIPGEVATNSVKINASATTPDLAPGAVFYYTDVSALTDISGGSAVNAAGLINSDTLSLVKFNGSGSFKIKGVSANKKILTPQYDLLVKISGVRSQMAGTPPGSGADTTPVYFGFCDPATYPDQAHFNRQ
ncbi:MAG: RICIN domain-containing protein, partial [Alistipes sp.]